MAENEKKEESCCSGGGGGCGGCGCGKKIFCGVVLLLLGGIIGYLMGGRCHKGAGMPMCPMTGSMSPAK